MNVYTIIIIKYQFKNLHCFVLVYENWWQLASDLIALLLNLPLDHRLLTEWPLYWHQRQQGPAPWPAQGRQFFCPKHNYGCNFLAVSLMKLLIFSRASTSDSWLDGWNRILKRVMSEVTGDRGHWSTDTQKPIGNVINSILPLKFVSRSSFTFVTTALRRFCNFP